MNNDFLTPDNENKKNTPDSTASSEEIFTYNEISEDVDVFDDSPVVADFSENTQADFDETADVFDRPVCNSSEPNYMSDTPPANADNSVTPDPYVTVDVSAQSDDFEFVDTTDKNNFVVEPENIDIMDLDIPDVIPDRTPISAEPTPFVQPAPVASEPQYIPPQPKPQYAPSEAPAQYYNPTVPMQPAQQPRQAYTPASPVTPVTFQSSYQQPETPVTPPAQPKKKNGGSTAFIIILWVLVGLFAIGFFGLCGYIIGTSKDGDTSATRPTLFGEETTTTSEADDTDDKTEASLPDAKPMPDENNLYSDSTTLELKTPPADKSDTAKYTTQYAYKKVATSTIGVVCYESGFSDEPASEGTGIILTKDGYIATNSHVIGDSRSLYSVQVITHDGEKYTAKVIGYDSRTDIAVLKIDASNLTPADFCDSQYIEVGQDVIAVGNPGGMGFQNSLTRGIISALDRELELSSQVSYIQTDAAINPGNSGGPLCNMYGQVIGINTAKISSSSYEGMGFAIPSALVKEIADDLIANGYVSNRVRLGISGQAVSSSLMQYRDIPAGILVGEISEDGPCDNSGLQVNDVITAIDDDKVESFSDVYGILAEHKPGDKVVLHVYRTTNGKELEITITLMADEGETQQ